MGGGAIDTATRHHIYIYVAMYGDFETGRKDNVARCSLKRSVQAFA